MKALIQHLNSSPRRAKLFEWGRLITITGTAQVAVQALGFAGGILVIRILPTQEYALYTLANTMVGTMLLLADGGIATGVMSQGGRVWQSRERLGAVLATGLQLRRKFATVSLVLALPALLYLLLHHGASWLMALFIVGALIPAFFTTLSGTLLEIAPKLHQDIVPMQRFQVESSVGRVALLSLSLFIFPWAGVAILVASLPQVWSNWRLRKLTKVYADETQPVDPLIQKEILAKVKRLLPDALYYCFACQFAIWLISIYGSTAAVAQVGALGRLAVALSLFTVLFSSLILPRFARLPDKAGLLFQHFTRLVIGLLGLSACLVFGTWLLATPILWVLGKQYAGLQTELTLMMVGKCLSMVASLVFLLCTSKGWIINPLISIPLGIISTGLGVLFFDFSSLQGIFRLDIFVAVVQLLMHATYGIFKIRQLANTSPQALVTTVLEQPQPTHS
jgi:O-antigen/teichoic acid export membrane protein